MGSEQIKDREEQQQGVVKPPVVMVPHPERSGVLWRFCRPKQVIQAATPTEVCSALAAIDAAAKAGYHVAGWLGYELGLSLEPRLSSFSSCPPRGNDAKGQARNRA